MKVKCEFCGSMINDTEASCPNCGAPNSGVRRTADKEPHTIAELQEWYKRMGLPPYEVTRFFIGINYTKPRAFGIYYDPATKHYVVYKNKDSGQRAIRYEGTDEAYAVNELLQRLKQEILQQKSRSGSLPTRSATPPQKHGFLDTFPGNILRFFLKGTMWVFGLMAAAFGIIMAIGMFVMLFSPKEGYYSYGDITYYHSGYSYDSESWFGYDLHNAVWSDPLLDESLPEAFSARRTAKKYFLQEKWDSSLRCSDFALSDAARDMAIGVAQQPGYYVLDGSVYYHTGIHYRSGWYVYSSEWEPVDYIMLPYPLKHSSLSGDCYRSEDYSPILGVPDFTDTLYYRDYIASTNIQKGYYHFGNHVFYHMASDYTEGWYSYDDHDWGPVESSDLPEEFHHPSQVEDFYFTPTWDASTQFTDFEDTSYYKDDKDKWNDSSDNDFSWDSGDSWDSSDSDWDSDW